MRSHIAWYVKGLPGSVEVKNQVFKATSILELKEILENYLNKLEVQVIIRYIFNGCDQYEYVYIRKSIFQYF